MGWAWVRAGRARQPDEKGQRCSCGQAYPGRCGPWNRSCQAVKIGADQRGRQNQAKRNEPASHDQSRGRFRQWAVSIGETYGGGEPARLSSTFAEPIQPGRRLRASSSPCACLAMSAQGSSIWPRRRKILRILYFCGSRSSRSASSQLSGAATGAPGRARTA